VRAVGKQLTVGTAAFSENCTNYFLAAALPIEPMLVFVIGAVEMLNEMILLPSRYYLRLGDEIEIQSLE